MSDPRVVAVIATYRRPLELARLFASLEKSTVALQGVVVTDNADDAATAEVMERCSIPHRLLHPGANLGCGGGLRKAEEEALREFSDLTHVLVLDDDVVLEPGTLGALLEAMVAHQAGAACPMPHDAEGHPNWYPGLLRREAFQALKGAATPADYLARRGPAPEAFFWATGVALLVSRRTLERAGLHRDDFWMRGEDLDFSLRVTRVTRGIFVPSTRIAHLPPGGGKVTYDFPERMKNAAMLQNIAFLSVWTPSGRAMAKGNPWNWWRHLKLFGARTWIDVLRAVWLGAVRGRPAGVPNGDYFRRRLAAGK